MCRRRVGGQKPVYPFHVEASQDGSQECGLEGAHQQAHWQVATEDVTQLVGDDGVALPPVGEGEEAAAEVEPVAYHSVDTRPGRARLADPLDVDRT